jgi:hypothetical protein
MRERTEVARVGRVDHVSMYERYAVTWRPGAGAVHSGRLELAPDRLVLANGSALDIVEYGELRGVRVGRTADERLAGRPTLVLDRRTGEPIRIAAVGQTGIISELAEHLSSRLGEEAVMSRAVVVLPLREGTSERAADLLRGGPPFDPEEVGLERHHVFLTDEEAVFVFEADSQGAAERLIAGGAFWSAASAWKDLVAGPPRLAEDAYSWVRPHVSEDLSFEPTPGQGDSDGGDVF